MEHAIEIAADHPSLAGHFPNNPIVPGAVILDMAAQALKDEVGEDVKIITLPRVKFISQLNPGQPAIITFRITGNSARFTCSANGKDIAVGQMEFTK